MKSFLLLAIFSTVVCVSMSAFATTLYPDYSFSTSGEGATWATAFKITYVEDFRRFQSGGRSRVYLVMDSDAAGTEGSRVTADLFLRAGLPDSLKLTTPTGKDLCECMKRAKKSAFRMSVKGAD